MENLIRKLSKRYDKSEALIKLLITIEKAEDYSLNETETLIDELYKKEGAA